MSEDTCLLNPDWEPSDQEEEAVAESFRRQVAWQTAMVKKGVKVLALGLSSTELVAEANRWWDEEGRHLEGRDSR